MAESSAPKASQRYDPAAIGVDQILEKVSQDDQEEWEYEYSTTETETYYLTIELSYPEFKNPPAKAHHHSRGGYYKNWLDQHSDNLEAKPVAHGLGLGDQSENENENEIGNEDEASNLNDELALNIEDESMPPIDPQLRLDNDETLIDYSQNTEKRKEDKGKQREGQIGQQHEQPEGQANEAANDKNVRHEPMGDIQILELHSTNPIISYKGRVFEGQWAEVLGTEVLLVDCEDGNYTPLPALRKLPGGVDLLGACASRILTKEKIPKPKAPKEDSLAAIRKEWNIKIPPGKDRTGERAEQIRFLENLMALKKKKGQTDDVTVYAVDGEGKDFDDRKGPDFKPRKRKPLSGNGHDDDGELSSRSGRRRSGRIITGRQTARKRRLSTTNAGGSAAGGDTTEWPIMAPSTLSTPTPGQWDDLIGDNDNGNELNLGDIDEESNEEDGEESPNEYEGDDDDDGANDEDGDTLMEDSP